MARTGIGSFRWLHKFPGAFVVWVVLGLVLGLGGAVGESVLAAPQAQTVHTSSEAGAAEAADDAAASAESMTLEEIFGGKTPATLEQLALMQDHFRAIARRVVPATVGIRVGQAQGSGVIVSPDGYVLTAAHVIGTAKRDAEVILPDGRVLQARTLGLDRQADSGLIRITDDGDWPYLEMGESAGMNRGQWVMAIGHPGGFDSDRSPVVRVGRILSISDRTLRSDCTLVGGDSGGPLVDMNGQVVGIHSRIGGTLDQNMHVPVDRFSENWDDLVAAVVIGSNEPWLGLSLAGDTMQVESVADGGPADTAGIRVGDILLKYNDAELSSQADLRRALGRGEPGENVVLRVRRGEEELDVPVELGVQ